MRGSTLGLLEVTARSWASSAARRAHPPVVGVSRAIANMRSIGAALVLALASGLAPQTKPSAAKVQQKRARLRRFDSNCQPRDAIDATPCPSPHLLAGVGLHAIDATSPP